MRLAAVALLTLLFVLLLREPHGGEPVRPSDPFSFVASADAEVVRRTVRRTDVNVNVNVNRNVVVRRPPYYAAPRVYPALPGGCVVVALNGVRAWRCGRVYYRSYSGGYVVFTP